MPTTIGILTPTGLIDASYTADSLADAVRYEPDGIYTNTRTYHRVYEMWLDAHLDRMEESAQLENMTFHLDREALRGALRTLIAHSGYEESRFRITVPRDNPTHFIITLEPLQRIPSEYLAYGVKMALSSASRQNPRSKTLDWVTQRETARQSLPTDAYEGILVNEQGQLLEGFSSNFYAIRDGQLFTANEDILNGISRRIVLSVAPTILPVNLMPITITDLPDIQEAFLTSSSRGVVPITTIDNLRIGGGQVGATTRAILDAYNAWVEAHLTPI